MIDKKIEDVYFKGVCEFIKERQDWYSTRFSYASCELWLCVEACSILNFDHSILALTKDQDNMFCYNEDDKRDLTIYKSDTEKQVAHIEAKLLYSGYSYLRSRQKIDEVFDKFNKTIDNEKNTNALKSGWIFMIWSSTKKGRYKNPDDFFNDSLRNIKESIEERHEFFVLDESKMMNVIDKEFDWRDDYKRIIVKAVYVSK